MIQTTPRARNVFGPVLGGADRTVKWLEKERSHENRALNTAIRVEGFRLKNRLQSEIRKGAPGGRQFAPLSFIARRYSRNTWIMGGVTKRTNPNRTALQRLAMGVRYDVNPTSPFAVAVGWVGPMTWNEADLGLGLEGFRTNQYSPAKNYNPFLNPLGRGITRSNITSKSWRRLAKKHQEGFTEPITPGQRRWIIRRGARLGTAEGGDTPFFLKKSTRFFHTPARPIMEPFWNRYRARSLVNIRTNYKHKLAGKRI